MNLSRHNRTLQALCPTCAGTSFADAEPNGGDTRVLKCENCGLELTEQALWEANAENVDVNLSEMKNAILQDVQKELHQTLKKAFVGNKNIRFK